MRVKIQLLEANDVIHEVRGNLPGGIEYRFRLGMEVGIGQQMLCGFRFEPIFLNVPIEAAEEE